MTKRYVIIGPSGVGKSYLMHQLVARHPDRFRIAELLTTRPPRPGEAAADRKFISLEDYETLRQADAFVWQGSFYGNHYGYTQESLVDTGKYVLLNALPPMIEEFTGLPGAVLIGMTIAPENFDVITTRLKARGDPAEAIKKRLSALQDDITYMAAGKSVITAQGAFFEIRDNTTIPAEIIPFIEKNASIILQNT